MKTVTASGASSLTNTAAATQEATRQAMAGLAAAGQPRAAFGFVFVGSAHRLELALSTAREMAKADLVGCTTAGEITERGLTKGGVSVMLVAGDELLFDLRAASGVKATHEAAALSLCARFADRSAEAKGRGWVASSTVTLVDGLAGTGEKLVASIMKGTRSYQQIVGGAAGDDGNFQATHVGSATAAGAVAGPDRAVALHLFGPVTLGVGVEHGLRPSTDKMVVTKARANVVHELDGQPAFEVYKRYARSRGVELTRDNADAFLINNELGVYFLQRLAAARAPLSVGDDGSLTLAADIAEGASVCILGGKRDELITAARAAAEEAKTHLAGREAAGVLLFDCICRGSILDKEFQREIDAVRAVFPKAPIAGFLTYGEIARYRGRLDGWHNTTAVVAAIPA